MDHIYEDLETITGERGLMTHMLPRANDAIKPWLMWHLGDDRFWNEEYDPNHTGETELPEPTEDERLVMMDRFAKMPNPFSGKQTISLVID